MHDPEDKVNRARELFIRNGAVQQTETELRKHYNNALHSLSELNVNADSKLLLKQLAENLISRKS